MAVRIKNCAGQATVELALVLPVAIIVAVITVNALLFISDCAQFDRLARQSVRIHMASPAHHQLTGGGVDLVSGDLSAAMSRDNLSTRVSAGAVSGGHLRVTAVLEFAPTLFGMGLKESVMGVSLPLMTHEVSLTVDTYKPGVVI